MSLLDFARGPALQWSLIVFVIGILWRLVGTVWILRYRDLSAPRSTATVTGGLRTILTRSAPPPDLEKNIRFQHYAGYAWHIGLFVVLLLYIPHIEFFKGILGFGWPGLPTDVVTVTAAITLALLVALLVRRMTHPVLRRISGPDDYISWFVTAAPLVTGFMAFAHLGPRYETMLAIHILSVELLLIWFPFGKLMHVITVWPSRYQIGATFQRRGVRA